MSKMLADGPYRTMLSEMTVQLGDTLVSTLRRHYGFNFIPTVRSIDDLRDVLLRIDEPSLATMKREFCAP